MTGEASIHNRSLVAAGHIHWAGSETAESWNDYIEGTLCSGARASAGVISQTAIGKE